MSSSSSSPAPQSSTNSSAPSKGGAGGGSGGGSPSSQPSSPPPSSPPPQAPPPKSSPPPSSPPPSPPPSSPPPKASPPPPPKSSPSPPPSSSPPSSPPPPSKSPPSSPPPPSSTSPPSGGDKPPPPPKDSPPSPGGGESPAQSPPSGDQSPPSGDESPPPPGDQSAPPPPLSPPAAPGTPSPPNPNPGAPPVPSPPAAPASNSTTKAPLAPPPPKTPSNSTAGQGTSSSGTTGTVIGLTVAGVFLLALIAVVFVFVRRRKKRHQVYPPNYMGPPSGGALKSEGYYQGPNSGQAESFYSNGPYPHSSFDNSYGSQRGSGPDSGHFSGTKANFSYEEMMEITNGFTRQNVLGEGGFGCVYKGWMPDGRVVAVKQLKAGSGQGEKEFRAEVDIISRVHHRHLVSLVGYCISDMQRMLIYEFVPNKTLEHHLHGPGMPVLEWTKRLKIALGSAKGLAYLHEDCHPKIIHRDIKSANILLDDVFEAQVADFGLAKLTSDTNTHVSTRVMGTFGYMAPEYASSGKLTDRSDVFSFGVVLLELVTGRKPVDPTQPLGDESLVEWARPLLIKALESGDLSELVDPRLEKHYVEAEMVRMIEAAAACVRHSATKRPRMAQVCRALDCEGELSDLSNGVKFGQSTAYDSGQYNEDIAQFRRMALGTSGGSSELDISSAEFTASREISGPQSIWTTPRQEVSSDESETRAFTNKGSASRSLRNNSVRRF